MTRLVWGDSASISYDHGVDRGVLYPRVGPGVVWNGLVSVEELVAGGGHTPYYFDGVKYYDFIASEDFKAEIQTYSVPPEFAACEGLQSLAQGFYGAQQPRERFGFSYRTQINNNLGVSYAYKLHLVYNAIVEPSTRLYSTQSQVQAVPSRSWTIHAVPVEADTYKPTAHYTIDSREVDPAVLSIVEDILYGDDTHTPRLPLPSEIVGLMLGSRFAIVIAEPDPDLLPPEAVPGDLVYSLSDDGVYSVDEAPANNTRPVFVIKTGDPIPEGAIVGDLVYNEDTGDLYRVGA